MKSTDLFSVLMTDGAGSGGPAPQQPASSPGPQQSQQPAQPDGAPGSGGESVAAGGSGGSNSCLTGCLGCGCLGAVGFAFLAIVGGVFALMQAPDDIGVGDFDRVVEMVEGAEETVETVERVESGGGAIEPGAPQTDEDRDRAARSFDDFFGQLEEPPMSSRDVRTVQNDLEAWGDSEIVAEFYDLHDSLERLEDEDSALRQLMGFRNMVRFAFNIHELGEQYHEEIEEGMGTSHRQLLVITRISQTGSSDDHEPWDQEVADALLEDHDAHQDEYEEARELIRKVAVDDVDPDELPEDEQANLAEAYADAVVLVTAALNRESLETWAGLSDDERRELIEELDAPHNWFGRIAATIFHTEQDQEHLIMWRAMGM